MRRAVLLFALSGVLAAPADARRTVPQGFIGVTAGPELVGHPKLVPGELKLMRASGVENIRVTFDWATVQPFANGSAVPASLRRRYRTGRGGVPTDLRGFDALIGQAARRRLRVLPVILNAPSWATSDSGRPASDGRFPSVRARDPADFARFIGTLEDRYGPRGSFWRAHRNLAKVPVRSWQIWNEPDYPTFWGGADFEQSRWAAQYVELLRVTRRTLKRADRRSTLVAAGMTTTTVSTVWEDLDALYRAGAKGLFDQAAVHVYTREAAGVIEALRRSRAVMRRHGDRRPLLLTEFGWTAATGRAPDFGWNVTDAGLAQRVGQVLPMLARARRSLNLRGVFWYTWLSGYDNSAEPFDYSGLRSLRSGRPRSVRALGVFRRIALRLEGRRR